jgi:hypothetical protein
MIDRELLLGISPKELFDRTYICLKGPCNVDRYIKEYLKEWGVNDYGLLEE